MTELSFILYLIGIAPSLASMAVTFGVLSWGYWLFIGFCSGDTGDRFWHPFKGWLQNGVPTYKPLIFGFLLFVISGLIPDKETMYYIAAIEFGDAALETETGQELISDIKEIINLQLENLKGN